MEEHSSPTAEGNSLHPVLLFDGICNLCSRAVDLVIRLDRHGVFRFASLQSDVGMELLEQYNLDPSETDSVVLVEAGRAYVLSTAALRIARRLGKMWAAFYVLIVVPRVLRDGAYKAIARRRYRWFGKREICRVPTPEEQRRFL